MSVPVFECAMVDSAVRLTAADDVASTTKSTCNLRGDTGPFIPSLDHPKLARREFDNCAPIAGTRFIIDV